MRELVEEKPQMCFYGGAFPQFLSSKEKGVRGLSPKASE